MSNNSVATAKKSNCYRQIIDRANKLVEKHQLKMKILQYQEQGQEGKPTFVFTSPGRVDFRELVKDINETFNTKVILHQVSDREAASVIGGLGPCGRELCCHQWLPRPLSISGKNINIANESGSTSTGACGRLCCCSMYDQKGFKLPKRRETKEEAPSLSEREVREKVEEEAVTPEAKKTPMPPQGKKKKRSEKKMVRKLVTRSKKRGK